MKVPETSHDVDTPPEGLTIVQAAFKCPIPKDDLDAITYRDCGTSSERKRVYFPGQHGSFTVYQNIGTIEHPTLGTPLRKYLFKFIEPKRQRDPDRLDRTFKWDPSVPRTLPKKRVIFSINEEDPAVWFMHRVRWDPELNRYAVRPWLPRWWK
jgi:hypothetical protein